MSTSLTLLDTPLTWQDVESEIQKNLGTTATFGENRKAVNLGYMKGFLSRIALIDADWIGLPDDIRLPKKLVVKISSTLALEDLSKMISSVDNASEEEKSEEEIEAKAQMVKQCHNLECQIYKIIERESNPRMPTTKMFASRSFTEENSSKGFLVFEFVEDVHSIPMYENVPYSEISSVIDTIAAFSAMGERMSEEERNATIGTRFLEDNIRHFFPDNSAERIKQELIRVLGDAVDEKIDIVLEVIDLICGKTEVLHKYSSICDVLGHKPVLMHSDLWSANMLFTKNDEVGLKFRALIDFQTVSLSSPGLDLASIAVSCLSSEDRNRHQEDYINRYYDSFVFNLKGAPPPYTLEQLRDSYDLYFPAAVILILPHVWSYAKYAGDEKALEAARNKTIGIVNDLIVIQESNKKKFPTFFNL